MLNTKTIERIYNAAVARGFYQGDVDKKYIIDRDLKHIKKECHEAYEAIDDFIENRWTSNRTDPNCLEKELSDIIMICISLSRHLNIDIEKHLMEKLVYNEKRIHSN